MRDVRAPRILLLASMFCSALVTSAHAERDNPPPVAVRSTAASEPGRPLLLSRVPTKDPVVFLTIDDGFTRSVRARAFLREKKWPVTSFPISREFREDPTWFLGLPGSSVGNHTVTHRRLKGLPFAAQRAEICDSTRQLRAGEVPEVRFFRPPFGAYDTTTLRAVHACGIPYVLLWRVTLQGRDLRTWGGTIRRGDIILLHYLPSLPQSLKFLDGELRTLGLRPAPLEEYLDRRAVTSPAGGASAR